CKNWIKLQGKTTTPNKFKNYINEQLSKLICLRTTANWLNKPGYFYQPVI
ncbi:4222_t:CDS:1, partial [Dentiscutata heterogama]